jgi:hypothetical protein
MDLEEEGGQRISIFRKRQGLSQHREEEDSGQWSNPALLHQSAET